MKRILLKGLRYSGIALGAFFALVILYVLFAILLAQFPVNGDFQPVDDGVEIFVQAGTIHTDIVLPVELAHTKLLEAIPLSPPENISPGYRYVGFGWGDREFYLQTPTWDDLDLFLAGKSLLWPTSSVMYVTYVYGELKENDYRRRVKISTAQYAELISFIRTSFQANAAGDFQLLESPGYSRQEQFYVAREDYHSFNNCNNWTNRALKEIGIKTAAWGPFPKSVIYHLK